MKKKLFALFAALTLVMALALPAGADSFSGGFIYDGAALLSPEGCQALENQAAEISGRHGCGVYIVTLADYQSYGAGDVFDVTESLFLRADNGFGLGSDKDGVLLLLSMAERDWALYVYGPWANTAFNAYGQEQLEEEFLPGLRENDWQGAFESYLSACDAYLTQAEAGNPVRESPLGGILLAVGISCVLALVVCLVLKGQLKTVRPQAYAGAYTCGGLNLTAHRDQFTHTTETRRRIEKPSNSGSQSHTSSSGGSGRSGKF